MNTTFNAYPLTTSASYIPGYQRFLSLPKTPTPTSGGQGFKHKREPIRDISHSSHPHNRHTTEEDRDVKRRQGKSSLLYNAADTWWKARSSKVKVTCLLHSERHSWTWGIKTCPHTVHPVVYIERLGMEGELRYGGQSLECWFRVNTRGGLTLGLTKLAVHTDGTLPRPWGHSRQCVYTVRCSRKICWKNIYKILRTFGWDLCLQSLPSPPLFSLLCKYIQTVMRAPWLHTREAESGITCMDWVGWWRCS